MSAIRIGTGNNDTAPLIKHHALGQGIDADPGQTHSLVPETGIKTAILQISTENNDTAFGPGGIACRQDVTVFINGKGRNLIITVADRGNDPAMITEIGVY